MFQSGHSATAPPNTVHQHSSSCTTSSSHCPSSCLCDRYGVLCVIVCAGPSKRYHEDPISRLINSKSKHSRTLSNLRSPVPPFQLAIPPGFKSCLSRIETLYLYQNVLYFILFCFYDPAVNGHYSKGVPRSIKLSEQQNSQPGP